MTVQKSNALRMVTRIKTKLLSTPNKENKRYTAIASTLKSKWNTTTLGLAALLNKLYFLSAAGSEDLLAELD